MPLPYPHPAISPTGAVALTGPQKAGRDRAGFFTPEMLASVSRKGQLKQRFDAAIRNGEFLVHYEPIVPLATECGLRAEALLRWCHPRQGLLTAAQFIDIFEDDSLAAQIGSFVVETVIRQLESWRTEGVSVTAVTVNATLADFRSPSFVDRILKAIADGRITNAEICVEITEDVLLDDGMHYARTEIERLQAAGVCLIFDDFGTGYASLRHLRDMPICGVKIDRSFVKNITNSAADYGLVEGMISIAHRLDRVVIAEGVETSEQLEILRAMGCDLIQGYLVSRALSASDVVDFAARIALPYPNAPFIATGAVALTAPRRSISGSAPTILNSIADKAVVQRLTCAPESRPPFTAR